MTFREPLGVVGLIVPWNFPLADRLVEGGAGAGGRQHRGAEAGRADAADRAASSSGSRSRRASPRASSTWSPGPGSVCGRRLVEHPDVAKIAFTGSTEVGRGIAEGAAATIKRVTLELGGKSANVVFADADLRARRPRRRRWRCSATRARTAAPARGSWWSARSSTASSRRSMSEVQSMRVGDPLDEATQMGPLISADQREKVASYVPDDAPVAIRGPAPEGAGYWFPPTVLAPVSNYDRAARRGDLRPGGLRDPVRGRARGGASSPTTRSTACRARSGPATARKALRVRARDRDRRAVDQLEHLGARRRLRSAASSSRAWGASSGPTRSSTTPT